jgi:ketosteroid isomerase-like protein
MDQAEMHQLAEKFLDAWNSQDVERVVSIYAGDVSYADPNTRGPVQGADAMRRYLKKLFGNWRMHWSLREAYLLDGGEGCAVLWHATFSLPGGGTTVETDGMDLVLMQGDRIARNEVYFDRVALASLWGTLRDTQHPIRTQS